MYPTNNTFLFMEDLYQLEIHFHNAVWGIQRQNTNSQKLTIKRLSKISLKRCTRFCQAHSSDEQNITLFIDFAFYIGFLDLTWVMSSAGNIDLVKKRKLGPE